ncbi:MULTISPECIES: arylamine N-acetyltransferase family protein [Streptomyces]|uniref:arylamine N-acetyltransferase family protein n=1 Tax=Streptomyces TaxID=1883 RepID=UPI000F9C6921|nr:MULTISPECIES: arylamine N-acetyltransferase [Streptomyces]NEE32952.1 arylamine N-acetyltransferase [Streptomyces sp. SID7982]RPK92659.1 N-hydroxyarylamine O-acetyltransferase [Streptomyces sp. ADI98-12]
MDTTSTDAYLRRLGADRPARPDADALRDLHLRHLLAVPFENLSVHLGEEIPLDGKSLTEKITARHRGGFCYELNGAFGTLLAALGYRVDFLQARVMGPDGLPGVPYDHMALRVEDADGGRWLADVGFGAYIHRPLAYDARGEQRDGGGVFRFEAADGGDLVVVQDGVAQYLWEERPRELADFRTGSWWHRTSPDSHFRRSLVCSLLTDGGAGRVTLSGRTLKATGAAAGEGADADGTRLCELGSDAEVLEAYRTLFGVELTAVPEVAPAPVAG